MQREGLQNETNQEANHNGEISGGSKQHVDTMT